jgi:isopentenyl-diphosphate delta-isomerase
LPRLRKSPATLPPKQPKSGATPSRKADHIRINIERDVAGKGVEAGFDAYRLTHRALPGIDISAVDTHVELFGKTLAAPILISCMTGGAPEARRINRRLARVAQRYGLAMGTGSARALLEDPSQLDTFDVRADAPDVLLFANLGAVQLNKGYGVDDCKHLIDVLQADALVLHLNPLQEALQPEGDTCFSGLLAKIEAVCASLNAPVVVKEVGWGIAPRDVVALLEAGVAAVDLAGAGGTSWSEVERYRIGEPWRKRVAAEFASWGIPTAQALREARALLPDALLIASGGIRNGIDITKALALGADLVGLAGPFLKAADRSEERADELARELTEVLSVAMFSLGVRVPKDLRSADILLRS